MDLKETKLSSEPIYEGSFVTISRDRVRLPNGNESQRVVIRHPGAACVLAETEDGKVFWCANGVMPPIRRRWNCRRVNWMWRTKILPNALCVSWRKKRHMSPTASNCCTPFTLQSVFAMKKMYLYQAQGVRLGSELSNDEDEITETVLMSKEEVRKCIGKR